MIFYLAEPMAFGSRTLPAHTRGLYVGGNGSGALMCVNLSGDFAAAFQFNDQWKWKT